MTLNQYLCKKKIVCFFSLLMYIIVFLFSFPNLSLARVLLTHCTRWIDINAIEPTYGNTALHISCQNTTNDSLAVVQLLIDSGAHIDSMNIFKQTPFDLAQTNEIRTLLKSKQLPSRLKCLCARLIIENQLSYEFIWPKGTDMNRFLYLHGSLAKQCKTKRKLNLCIFNDLENFHE